MSVTNWAPPSLNWCRTKMRILRTPGTIRASTPFLNIYKQSGRKQNIFYIKFGGPFLTIALFLSKNPGFKCKKPKNTSYKVQNSRMGPQSRHKGFGEVSRNTSGTPNAKKPFGRVPILQKVAKWGPNPLINAWNHNMLLCKQVPACSRAL